jgi:hypothetical protein
MTELANRGCAWVAGTHEPRTAPLNRAVSPKRIDTRNMARLSRILGIDAFGTVTRHRNHAVITLEHGKT